MDGKRMFAILFIGFLFLIVLAAGWFMFRWQYNRADSMLDEWAQKEGYTVISKEDANPPGTGPKDRYAGNKQIWYRVTLKDGEGKQRKALVKLGSASTGTISDNVEVEWLD